MLFTNYVFSREKFVPKVISVKAIVTKAIAIVEGYLAFLCCYVLSICILFKYVIKL